MLRKPSCIRRSPHFPRDGSGRRRVVTVWVEEGVGIHKKYEAIYDPQLVRIEKVYCACCVKKSSKNHVVGNRRKVLTMYTLIQPRLVHWRHCCQLRVLFLRLWL